MPILRGYTNDAGTSILVYCPYCNCCHRHGWPGPLTPRWHITERAAHCGTGTPFDKTGYYIGLLPKDFAPKTT